MPEQTTVTKTVVPGSTEIPKGQGDDQKELENRVRENLRGEYARKEADLQEKYESAEARIAELEEQSKLSQADKELLERLRDRKDTLSDELRELETNPKNFSKKLREIVEDS